MDNRGDILQLCRLCLVKDDVNIPIFEEQGDIRQIFLKISSCLPVKVDREDKLPKKICDGCSYKLDMFYDFWNSTANAEKQLMTWLGEAGMTSKMTDGTIAAVTQQAKPNETVVKQEELDPSDIHTEENDDKSYMFHQKFSEDEPGPSATTINDEPPPKRARRTAAVKAQIAMDPESDDDEDSGEPLTKVEDESEESEGEDHDPNFVDVPSTSADDQPGPSGVGKDGDAPINIQQIGSHFYCNLCKKLFTSIDKIKRHTSRIHKPRTIPCELCDEKFLFKYLLETHKKFKHFNTAPYFHCDLCDKKYRFKRDLYEHKNTFHLEKYKMYCSKCLRGFNRDYELRKHEKKVHENMRFQCSHCNKYFKDKYYYKSHVKTHESDYECKVFPCSECPKVFTRVQSFNFHMRTHKGNNKYICDTCGKVVTSKASLQEHIRTHTGEKPFSCDFCEKGFAKRSCLINHRRTHTKEKPFVCKECGKSFSQGSTLKLHIRYHTGERPFECCVCLKKFVTSTLLRGHKCKGPQHVISTS